jgi:hypothetical protein
MRIKLPRGRSLDGSLLAGFEKERGRLVRPGGETFAVSRDGEGLDRLVACLRQLSPTLSTRPASQHLANSQSSNT